MFHCNLFIRASSSISLRPHQAQIQNDHEETLKPYISDGKIDNWPRMRGHYLQFLAHPVSFDILEWMLLEQVDD